MKYYFKSPVSDSTWRKLVDYYHRYFHYYKKLGVELFKVNGDKARMTRDIVDDKRVGMYFKNSLTGFYLINEVSVQGDIARTEITVPLVNELSILEHRCFWHFVIGAKAVLGNAFEYGPIDNKKDQAAIMAAIVQVSEFFVEYKDDSSCLLPEVIEPQSAFVGFVDNEKQACSDMYF